MTEHRAGVGGVRVIESLILIKHSVSRHIPGDCSDIVNDCPKSNLPSPPQLAQMVEPSLGMREVTGSMPVFSINMEQDSKCREALNSAALSPSIEH